MDLARPHNVRGGQIAKTGWSRQADSVMITYFFQYLMFYCGLYILYQGNLITALIPFITMFGVPRLLDKFGYSSGTGGVGNAVTSIIFQGASLIARAWFAFDRSHWRKTITIEGELLVNLAMFIFVPESCKAAFCWAFGPYRICWRSLYVFFWWYQPGNSSCSAALSAQSLF